ncbi:MAG: hypothetical protein KAS87_05860, partial [Candidatus Omnitrophica bacterium]|nr:hypothetical protein [Candidatus Omnitrophota bacterium]
QEKDAKSVFEFIIKSTRDDLAKILAIAESTTEFTERDAESISEFIKKFSKDELEKTAILAETERAIQEKDARDIFDFITKSPKEDLAKILAIAEATTEFKVQDAESISEFIKKFSKDELEKTAILAETERVIEEKDARGIFEFVSKTPKEDLAKILAIGEATKEFKVQDAESISTFIKKFSTDELEKTAMIASIWGKAILTQEGVIPLDERKIEEIQKKIKDMKEIGDINDDEFEEIENVLEQVRRLRSLRSLPYNLIPTKDDAEKVERIQTILAVAGQLSEEDLKEPSKTEVPSNTSEIKVDAIDSKDYVGISTTSKLEDRIKTIEDVQLISIPKLYRTGTNFINKRAFEEAYEWFDLITEISPNLKGAWLNKGVALFGLDKIKEELECYEEALWIDEKYDKALRNKEIAERKLNFKG